MDGLELNISTEPAAPRVHTRRTKKLHRRAWKGLDGRHRKQHRDAAAGGASIRVKEAPIVGPLPGRFDARKRKGVADGGAGAKTKSSIEPSKKAVVPRSTVPVHASIDESVAGGQVSDDGRSPTPEAKRAKIVKTGDEGGAPSDHCKAERETGGAGGKGKRSKPTMPTHPIKALVSEPTVAVSGQADGAEAGKTATAATKAAASSKQPQARPSHLLVDVKTSNVKPMVQSGAAAFGGKPNKELKEGAKGGATRGKQNAKDEQRTCGVQGKGLEGGKRAKVVGVTQAGSVLKGRTSSGKGPGGIVNEEGAGKPVQQGTEKPGTFPASSLSETKVKADLSRGKSQPSASLTGSSSVKKQESPSAGGSRRHPIGATDADQRHGGSKPTEGRDAARANRGKKGKLPPADEGGVGLMSGGNPDEEDAEAMGEGEERPTRKKPAPVEQQRLNEYHARPCELSATAVPTPLSSKTSKHIFTTTDFSGLGLHDRFVDVLKTPKEHHGFELKTATRVQSAALPAVLRGKNALISSETGSGKTLAYLLPILQQLQAIEPPACRSDGTHVLVVSPTRELCHQIYNVLMRLVRPFIRIVPGIVTGGEKRKSEKARLRKGIVVLVGTPGRLLDHLQNTQSFKYDHVQWLVLDEVDRLLDMGFESQVRSIVKQIRSKGRGSVQLVAASATITASVDQIARSLLGRHLRVDAKTSTVEEVEGEKEDAFGEDGDADEAEEQIAGEAHTDEELHGDDDDDDVEEKPATPTRAEPAEQFTTPKQLAQQYMLATCKLRLPALASVLRVHAQKHKAVVFMSTCDSVDFHHALFTKTSWPTEKVPLLGEAISVFRLHGNIPQAERLQNLRAFSESKVGVLFCTDVASRGLDLPSVDWIIQYDPPTDAAEYVHRVGRTARRGQKGYALIFLLPSERGFLGALKDKGLEPSPLSLQHTLAAATPSRFARFRAPEEVFTMELQQGFEKAVEEDAALLKLGRLAFQSFVRAYAAHSVDLKHIFMVRGLHLGHVAKSFALRSPPTALKVGKQQIKIPQAKRDGGAADTKTKRGGSGDDTQHRTKKQKVDDERPQKQWLPGKKSLLSMASEFASG